MRLLLAGRRATLGVLAALLLTACATAPPRAAAPVESPEPVHLRALYGHDIIVLHVTPQEGLGTGTPVVAEETIGAPLPLPPTLSQRHHAAIETAGARYQARQYDEALAAIVPAYRDEPENPFVLEVYARTLYRLERRAEAFEPYRRLVALLDAQRLRVPQAGARSVLIDMWFIDAYWKLGTLHMDRAEYDRAAFEISRSLATGADSLQRLDQAYSYLTKAYFYLGDHEAARAFGRLALRNNPRNQYVRPFLEQTRPR
jgi:predicted Zn-dependent protease